MLTFVTMLIQFLSSGSRLISVRNVISLTKVLELLIANLVFWDGAIAFLHPINVLIPVRSLCCVVLCCFSSFLTAWQLLYHQPSSCTNQYQRRQCEFVAREAFVH